MKYVLYPDYFDPRNTRKYGRRISKPSRKLIDGNDLREILKSLNIHFSERTGKYPRTPWRESFIFEVESEVKKGTLLKMIERKIAQS
ncbi:MAG: hypothetical protein M1267_02795 [Candidatus Thermoplasmatota archaeon]|jgi:signal recognition particle subunit SRP19|nr:hypothetical protein [Candidatus Thermoplasmatota archaeon]MCL5800791.1 hypothetical protein [Candidatus Thermoplasmatota archaeon]